MLYPMAFFGEQMDEPSNEGLGCESSQHQRKQTMCHLGRFGSGGPEKMAAAGRPANPMRLTTAGPTSFGPLERDDRELGLTAAGEDWYRVAWSSERMA